MMQPISHSILFLALLTLTARAQSPLVIEDLGPMAHQANVTLGPLAPSPDGAGFVQLLFSFPEGGVGYSSGPFEIVAVNLQTGTLTRTKASNGAASVGWQVWSHVWGRDGKLYLGTNTPPHLISWDPKTQTARDHGRRWAGVKNAVCVYSLSVGTDGAIYGGGCNVSAAFRFDPQSGQTQEFGVLGLPRTTTPAYAYSIAADRRYIYAASGKIPWYLVAYDRQTGTQKNLKTFSQYDFIEMHQHADAVYARVLVAASGSVPIHYDLYALANGQATSVTSTPQKPVPVTPLPKTTPPLVFLDRAVSAGSLAVTLWYRPVVGDWKAASVPVFVQPYLVDKLATLSAGSSGGGGRVVGASRPYGEMFTFDPATGKGELLGSHQHTSVYGMRVVAGKLYFSGYPLVPLHVYDPAKPWTVGKDTPTQKAPPLTDPASNSRQLLIAGNAVGAHYGRFVVGDFKGRIHIGAHAERIRNGGAFVTYDPASAAWSGIGAPKFTHYDCEGLAATSDGRFVVYSSRVVSDPANPTATPSDAKLFIYDAAASAFVREVAPLPGMKTTGLLATGRPGQVVGSARKGAFTLFYAVDAASGAVLWQREAPGVPMDSMYGANPFVAGPDHFLWTFLGDRLTKVNPITGEAATVGVVPWPGDFTFSGGDLYLAGTTNLRRIKGLVPAPCPY